MYHDLLEKGSRYPGFESFLAARFAAWLVYRMAGIKVPIDDLDLVELHDAFTISDLQTYGDIGLRPYGQEQDYIESGDAYYINPDTGKPGRCPSNLSGGLLEPCMPSGPRVSFRLRNVSGNFSKNMTDFTGIPDLAKMGKRETR